MPNSAASLNARSAPKIELESESAEAEVRNTPNDATKLNMNIVTVCALAVMIAGGAWSVGILYEQGRRHEASIKDFTDSIVALRVTVAQQGAEIKALADRMERTERNGGKS